MPEKHGISENFMVHRKKVTGEYMESCCMMMSNFIQVHVEGANAS